MTAATKLDTTMIEMIIETMQGTMMTSEMIGDLGTDKMISGYTFGHDMVVELIVRLVATYMLKKPT